MSTELTRHLARMLAIVFIVGGFTAGVICQDPTLAAGNSPKKKKARPSGIHRGLPDLSLATYLGAKPPVDKLSKIPGKETTLKGYRLGHRLIVTYSLPNGKIYGFGIANLSTGEKKWFWDYENDGNFEQQAQKGAIDASKYGY